MKRSTLKRKTPLKRGPWRRKPKSVSDVFCGVSQKHSLLPHARRMANQKSAAARLGMLKSKQPTLPQRMTWMPRQSEKRKLESEIYKLQRVRFLQEHPLCELMVTCGALSVLRNMPGVEQIPIRRKSKQVHHRRGRGRWYLDERYWLATCRGCHAWEDSHRNEAVKLGLRERIREKH